MNMYTQPNYRKQGIAMYLFAQMIAEAKRLGYQKLCLHATEKGKPLYRKYGFRGTNDEMILNLE
jgi:GNAT superfamily N-acetyltransferase